MHASLVLLLFLLFEDLKKSANQKQELPMAACLLKITTSIIF
jgi:hypothetical protein